MEQELLNANKIKLAKSRKLFDDPLQTSFEKVKSIDKSLRMLQNVNTAHEGETVDVSGSKMNKLWFRLTGLNEDKFSSKQTYNLTKTNLSKFYEEAKETVLENDMKILLETSIVPRKSKDSYYSKKDESSSDEGPKKDVTSDEEFNKNEHHSDVDTMDSIANIETEEEYPATFQPETNTSTDSENEQELQEIMANQMKVFVDQKKFFEPVKDEISVDKTFQVQRKSPLPNEDVDDEINKDKSTSTIGIEDMDIIQQGDDSQANTEPIESIDLSAVDESGSIIPDIPVIKQCIKITDMDQDDDDESQLIEDISFPNLEISLNDTPSNNYDDDRGHDLSTITECTEYEQCSSEPISTESATTASENVNSEIEQRLISINDSLEQVGEAFKKVPVLNPSGTPSSFTNEYSTDKDFAETQSAITSTPKSVSDLEIRVEEEESESL